MNQLCLLPSTSGVHAHIIHVVISFSKRSPDAGSIHNDGLGINHFAFFGDPSKYCSSSSPYMRDTYITTNNPNLAKTCEFNQTNESMQCVNALQSNLIHFQKDQREQGLEMVERVPKRSSVE
jgi:hypothetical protein